MKRFKLDALMPGDIVLTARDAKVSKGIRFATGGLVSHAMICVQHGSLIDSTGKGVLAWNVQREWFEDDEDVFAFRMRGPLTALQLSRLTDHARSQVGARYSVNEAKRVVLPGRRPRGPQQFCSRLVAQSYAYAGIKLVGDQDYCSPEELRISPLLRELADVTEQVPEGERAAWTSRPNPIDETQRATNQVLTAARALDPTVENFQDLDRLVFQHPEWDATIADVYRSSGYLGLWRRDVEINPWHYDLDAMEHESNGLPDEGVRDYCVSTIREAASGSFRYPANLVYYQSALAHGWRETTELLVELYERLIRLDEDRRNTAVAWLRRHFPGDVDANLERVEPHSEQWFAMIERVEPRLNALARQNILQSGSAAVCSSCGDDETTDYLLTNSADAMPGVPSLRLCRDCVTIRRGFGERLEAFPS